MAQQTYASGEVLTAADLNAELVYVPFRYYAGKISGSGTFTVTLPVGRFTVNPIVITQSKSVGSNVAFEFTTNCTTTGFTIERNIAGTWNSDYIVIQALLGAGAGP